MPGTSQSVEVESHCRIIDAVLCVEPCVASPGHSHRSHARLLQGCLTAHLCLMDSRGDVLITSGSLITFYGSLLNTYKKKNDALRIKIVS